LLRAQPVVSAAPCLSTTLLFLCSFSLQVLIVHLVVLADAGRISGRWALLGGALRHHWMVDAVLFAACASGFRLVSGSVHWMLFAWWVALARAARA
jgi:hypothetical protein